MPLGWSGRARPAAAARGDERQRARRRRTSFCSAFALLGVSAAEALEPRHPQRWGSEDGLPHNSVYALAQDRDGFVWIGTPDGLARFDGGGFRVHRADEGGGGAIRHTVVRALVATPDGSLWVGSDGGLDRRRPDTDRFDPIRLGPPAEDARVVSVRLLATGGGRVWVGTDLGLFVGGLSGDRFAAIALPAPPGAGETIGLVAAADGGAFVITGTSSGERARLHSLDARGHPLRARDLAADGGSGALHLDRERGRLWWTPRVSFDADTLEPRIDEAAEAPESSHAVERDLDGDLWFGGDAGLFRRPATGGPVEDHTSDLPATGWLGRYVRALLVDRTGGLWVGGYAGLTRFDPYARRFDRLTAADFEAAGVRAPAVSAIAEAGGRRWLGTLGGGLVRLDDRGRIEARLSRADARSAALPGDSIWSLAAGPGNRLWIGGEEGLAALDLETGRLERIELPYPPEVPLRVSARVMFLAWEAERRLWIAAHSGLYRLDAADGSRRRIDLGEPVSGPNALNVESLAIDERRGCVWVGTARRGLLRVDLRSDEVRSVASPFATRSSGARAAGEGLFDLAPDADGGLWIGSGAGLSRFDPDRGDWRHWSPRDGLPGSIVYSVEVASDGRLWLGTNRGLARFDRDAATEAFRNYDLGDGIAGLEYNRHSSWRAADGELYFGGVAGLTRFRPEAIEEHPVPPPVRWTEIEVLGTDGARPATVGAGGELELAPGEDGFVARFAALAYFQPAKNRFRYRLIGHDRDWIDGANRGEARYARLAPGGYRLEVVAANADGIWNREGATLVVRVRPPFHRTAAFRALLALAAAVLLALAYRLRVAHLLALERVRLRVASDLHDDLSSNLAGIAVAAELVDRRVEMAGPERARLRSIRATALELVDAVRDSVWSVSPEHDSVASLALRLRQAAASLLGELPVEVEIEAEPGRPLDMETRRQLYLIAKEALHNVARHADARRVAIRLRVAAGRFELEVRDDGRGFEPACAARGEGLRSLRRRAEALGTTLEIASATGSGTTVRVMGAVARTRDRRASPLRRSVDGRSASAERRGNDR